MVKITTRALKIGMQSRFYPISTMGFRTFSPENFGQAYYTVSEPSFFTFSCFCPNSTVELQTFSKKGQPYYGVPFDLNKQVDCTSVSAYLHGSNINVKKLFSKT